MHLVKPFTIPQKNNYALSVISDEIKYWFNSEIDYKELKINKILNEKMFVKESNGEFNEENNILSSNNLRSEYFEIANAFLNSNLSFHKKITR